MNLILADCLPALRKMKTKSVDLVLTDPPYGIGHGKARGANSIFRHFVPQEVHAISQSESCKEGSPSFLYQTSQAFDGGRMCA